MLYALAMTEKFDIAVVGGGVMGLTCAWKLAVKGMNVVLLERGICGEGSTVKALGGLVPYSFSRNHAMAQMERASLEIYPDFIKDLETDSGLNAGYARCGRVQIIATKGQRESMERDAAASGNIQQMISAEKALELEPNIRVDDALGALYCPLTGRVQPQRMVDALKSASIKRGVDIRENYTVENIAEVRSLAKQVIVTAGAWTMDLLPEHIIKPVKGQGLELKPSKKTVPHLLPKKVSYSIPHDDGNVIIGSTTEPEAGFDETPTKDAKDMLWETAIAMAPDLADAELIVHWAGLRPRGETSLPLAKRLDETTLVAAGHYKIGLCLAPKVAEVICGLVI